MKQINLSFFIFLIWTNTLGQVATPLVNEDTLAVRTKSYAMLIDGAVRNLESAGTKELASTGLIGFIYDDERYLFKISISAFSNIDSIFSKSKEVKPYSNTILNAGVTNTGFGSLAFEFHNRFISNEGFKYYLVKKNYLAKENPDDKLYETWLANNKLSGLSWFKKFIGWRFYTQINNTVWKNTAKANSTANVASFGLMLTYYKMFINNNSLNIDATLGIGATGRVIFNDLGQDEAFREGILGTKQKSFFGPEIYVGIRLNNLYAKMSIPILLSDTTIKGLTGGQPIVSLGITADIGYKNTQRKILSNVGKGVDGFSIR